MLIKSNFCSNFLKMELMLIFLFIHLFIAESDKETHFVSQETLCEATVY